MNRCHPFSLVVFVALGVLMLVTAHAETPTAQQIIAQASPSAWRNVDPDKLLVMTLDGGHKVIIELAPTWAPAHVANIKRLVKQHYFDGTSVYRVKDNFVAQWGDPYAKDPSRAKAMGDAKPRLAPEDTRQVADDFQFTALPSRRLRARQLGFSHGLPVARDRKGSEAWLVHCRGMLAVARDSDPASGSGNTLYVPIGRPLHHLDKHMTVVGQVLKGLNWLASLPPGDARNGTYTDPHKRTGIESIRLAASLPPGQRPRLQVLRSDSQAFQRLMQTAQAHATATPPQTGTASKLHNLRLRLGPHPGIGNSGLCKVPRPVRTIPGGP